ncbi:MAG: tRNA1(Val) (adenine(37)-N6)-methyltransferase [Defluviitaleaceae bacterium]|nr:tRNA1(Val) (adenine(37)-N6)-methyltransferase [Defluviitaleaceae bacterium]
MKDCERVDDLQLNGLVVIQDPAKFLFGIDAVKLSDFVSVGTGERALDMCTGSGVIPLLLSAKGWDAHYTGIEIQPEVADMARRSVALNAQAGAVSADRITIHTGDIRDTAELYKPSSFDVITCNPPYIKVGAGLLNEAGSRAAARHELFCTLDDVVSAAARLLRPGGRFAMVHKPHRLAECFEKLRQCRLEPTRLCFVHAAAHKEPSLFLVEAVRGGGAFLRVLPPIIIN